MPAGMRAPRAAIDRDRYRYILYILYLVQDVLCLLACARHGLHEDELLQLCAVTDPRVSPTSAITYPDVALPRLKYAQLMTRMGAFLRGAPRWGLRSLQFQQWAMLRAVQKNYFPDSFPASALWVKVCSFAMARDRASISIYLSIYIYIYI